MKTISAGLKTAIANGEVANLVKVTTQDATTFGYTDHDVQLTVGGVVYQPAPGLSKIRLTMSADAKVSNQEYGMAWLDAPEEDLANGVFDNAQVEVMWVGYNDLASGTMTVFKGKLGIVQWNEDGFRVDIHSLMRDLGRNIGFIVTPSCRHKLFSDFSAGKIGACTLSEPSFTYTGTVSSVTTDRLIFEVTGSFPATDQWCTHGKITFTLGNNAGEVFEVKKFTVGAFTTVELALPTTKAIQVSDQFSITAGCDKTIATCTSKFSNTINFGGFPHIQSEIMYR